MSGSTFNWHIITEFWTKDSLLQGQSPRAVAFIQSVVSEMSCTPSSALDSSMHPCAGKGGPLRRRENTETGPGHPPILSDGCLSAGFLSRMKPPGGGGMNECMDE